MFICDKDPDLLAPGPNRRETWMSIAFVFMAIVVYD